MKKSAIIRIIISSVVLLLLIAILVVGLVGNGFGSFNGFSFSFFSYADADLYKAGNATLSTDSISKLDVNWVSGSVKISTHSGDKLIVEETSSGELEQDERLQYYVSDDGYLHVQFWEQKGLFSFHDWNTPEKNLTIYIPEEQADLIKTLKVDSVSAEVSVKNLKSDTLEFDSVSGGIKVSDIGDSESIIVDTVSGEINISADTETIDVDTVSGEIYFNGSASDKIECDSTSGEIDLNTEECPEKVNIDTISGSVTLSLPENCKGFTAEHDSVSGSFNCEFPTTSDDDDDDKSVYGDGSADFNFDTISGSVKIKKR